MYVIKCVKLTLYKIHPPHCYQRYEIYEMQKMVPVTQRYCCH